MINRKNIFVFLLLSLIALIYTLLALKINKSLFIKTNYAYFNYLLNAFIHRRLNVLSPIVYDLSLFKNQWFLYWGPAPVFFIAPFYLIGRLQVSDILYTLVAGILNVFIFYFLIIEFNNFFKLKLTILSRIIILLGFAFISPNLNLSINGRIWQSDQIISIFYLLLFLIFFFKFLNNIKSWKFLVLSIIFYNLAWLSRYTLIFYFVFFTYPIIKLFKQNFKYLKKTIFIIFGITLIFVLLFFAYNYLRFGNILETGIKYQMSNQRFIKDISSNQIFSFKNFNYNFFYYFLNHLLLSYQSPNVKIDPEGNSIFSVYPLFVLIFFVFQIKLLKNKKINLYIFLSLLVIITNLFVLLLTLGTGWIQFGNRYFFDIVVLLFLLILLVIENIPLMAKILLTIYGIFINIYGTLVFFNSL